MINHNGQIDSVISTISIIYGNTITHQTTHLPNYILTTPPVTISRSHYLIHSLTHWTIHSLTLSHSLIYPETPSFIASLTQSLHHRFNNLVTPNHFPTQLLLDLLLRSLNHSSTDPPDNASSDLSIHSPNPSIHSAMHLHWLNYTLWVWKGTAALLGFPVCALLVGMWSIRCYWHALWSFYHIIMYSYRTEDWAIIPILPIFCCFIVFFICLVHNVALKSSMNMKTAVIVYFSFRLDGHQHNCCKEAWGLDPVRLSLYKNTVLPV